MYMWYKCTERQDLIGPWWQLCPWLPWAPWTGRSPPGCAPEDSCEASWERCWTKLWLTGWEVWTCGEGKKGKCAYCPAAVRPSLERHWQRGPLRIRMKELAGFSDAESEGLPTCCYLTKVVVRDPTHQRTNRLISLVLL